MALLIDGYNLLHASGVLPSGRGPGTLHRARTALLNCLVQSLPLDEVGPVTIVFDAMDPPPGLPDRYNYQGILVLFARDHESADAMIEDMVQSDHAPRRLTVVSSDHRVQRAGKRRRTKVVDSDIWFASVVRQRNVARNRKSQPGKPLDPLSEDEVIFWLAEFAVTDDSPQEEVDPWSSQCETDSENRSSEPLSDVATTELDDVYNPFPPGHFDDVFDGDDDLENYMDDDLM